MKASTIAFEWYDRCVTLSCQYEHGTVENCFWWTLRMVFIQGMTFDEWLDYFAWKCKQLDAK